MKTERRGEEDEIIEQDWAEEREQGEEEKGDKERENKVDEE